MTIEERQKYDREWYKRNRERIKEKKNQQQRNLIDDRRLFIFRYLKEHPCVDCGENNPIVLEFDHINPIDKKSNISNLITAKVSKETLLKEIEKCEVRCANCHRIKTALQFNWYSRILDKI